MSELRDMHRIDYDRELDIMSVDGNDIVGFVALSCGRIVYVNTRDGLAGPYAGELVRGRLQLVSLTDK